MQVKMRSALLTAELAVLCLNELVTRTDAIPTSINPSLSHTGHHTPSKKKNSFFFSFVLCVFLVFYCEFSAIFVFSAFYHLIPSTFTVPFDSFIILCFLEFRNICCGIFLR
jgi:hypothetical protein